MFPFGHIPQWRAWKQPYQLKILSSAGICWLIYLCARALTKPHPRNQQNREKTDLHPTWVSECSLNMRKTPLTNQICPSSQRQRLSIKPTSNHSKPKRKNESYNQTASRMSASNEHKVWRNVIAPLTGERYNVDESLSGHFYWYTRPWYVWSSMATIKNQFIFARFYSSPLFSSVEHSRASLYEWNGSVHHK